MLGKFLSKTSLLIVAAMLWTAPVLRAEVWIVDDDGGADFSDIQSAVDFAADGDTLLVQPGSYPSFTLSGKGLSILADGGLVQVGHVRLELIPPGSDVLLADLIVVGGLFCNAAQRSGLLAIDVAGTLRVQECDITGSSVLWCGTAFDGSIGAELIRCDDVVFVRSVLRGGRGNDAASKVADGMTGGAGLQSVDSRVLLHECNAEGGDGGHGDAGGDGGPGARASGAAQVLVTVASTFLGGTGGDQTLIGGRGKGGAGLSMDSGAKGRTRASTFTGGPGGDFGTPVGPPLDLEPGTSFLHYAGSGRLLSFASSNATSGVQLLGTLVGEPGDRVWLLDHVVSSWSFKPTLAGVWTVPAPYLRPLVPEVVLPASGVAAIPFDLPPLAPGQEDELHFVQAFVLSAAGQAFTATTWAIVVTD